jgi:hypothetical protein
MRKIILAVIAVAVLALPASALAERPDPGGYQQPGYDQAIGNTECADHGAFGFFGDNGNPAYHDFGTNHPGGPGADGQATGDANSSLCGNPQS